MLLLEKFSEGFCEHLAPQFAGDDFARRTVDQVVGREFGDGVEVADTPVGVRQVNPRHPVFGDGFFPCPGVFVRRQPDDFESLVVIGLVGSPDMRHLAAAGHAVGEPEVEQEVAAAFHDLA